MSGLPAILKATEEDIKLLLSAQSHLGTKNCAVHMEPYVWKRRADGKHLVYPTLSTSGSKYQIQDQASSSGSGKMDAISMEPVRNMTLAAFYISVPLASWNIVRNTTHHNKVEFQGNRRIRVVRVHIINIGKTWEKIVLAARIIVAIENPADICVISARPY
ncbi:structural constituent of ribosome, partial [Mortierella sp. AM989]